jgi:hypothetical protein
VEAIRVGTKRAIGGAPAGVPSESARVDIDRGGSPAGPGRPGSPRLVRVGRPAHHDRRAGRVLGGRPIATWLIQVDPDPTRTATSGPSTRSTGRAPESPGGSATVTGPAAQTGRLGSDRRPPGPAGSDLRAGPSASAPSLPLQPGPITRARTVPAVRAFNLKGSTTRSCGRHLRGARRAGGGAGAQRRLARRHGVLQPLRVQLRRPARTGSRARRHRGSAACAGEVRPRRAGPQRAPRGPAVGERRVRAARRRAPRGRRLSRRGGRSESGGGPGRAAARGCESDSSWSQCGGMICWRMAVAEGWGLPPLVAMRGRGSDGAPAGALALATRKGQLRLRKAPRRWLLPAAGWKWRVG